MQKRLKVLIILVLSVTALSTLTVIKLVDDRNNKTQDSFTNAKNVIIFIGDGMGPSHRQAIQLATVGQSGELAMDDMPHSGIIHTSSTSGVTDSAAAGTAIATGVKTYNGAIGVDENKKPLKSILDYASQAGKATGLVTTSQITDATPAAFGSNVTDRSEHSDIAKQFIENSKVDLLLGGGEDFWFPAGNAGSYPDNPAKDPTEQSKGSEGNLVEKAKSLGYSYVTDRAQLRDTNSKKILGLFANEEMFEYGEESGDQYQPVVPLTKMTKTAIDTLSQNDKGFFLMVEEEGIDAMSEDNNAELMIKAGQELDKSVAIAKDYAKKHRDTLILVLADHETGGLSIEDASGQVTSNDGTSEEQGPFKIAHSKKKFKTHWSTKEHSDRSVPLTAVGPGSEIFTGSYENNHIFDKLKQVLG
ncbi:alkaline phosphatase [Peribacillus sp. SCS-155]|uniref:alkaline phosphatase n=1 Tax=Peribacillus sedimenti TaxID=3115297 RepID=UPI00390640E6